MRTYQYHWNTCVLKHRVLTNSLVSTSNIAQTGSVNSLFFNHLFVFLVFSCVGFQVLCLSLFESKVSIIKKVTHSWIGSCNWVYYWKLPCCCNGLVKLYQCFHGCSVTKKTSLDRQSEATFAKGKRNISRELEGWSLSAKVFLLILYPWGLSLVGKCPIVGVETLKTIVSSEIARSSFAILCTSWFVIIWTFLNPLILGHRFFLDPSFWGALTSVINFCVRCENHFFVYRR